MNLAQYRLLEGADLLADNTYEPTLSNTVDLPHVARHGLLVFAAGAVKFSTTAGVDDTWTVPASPLPMHIPVAIKRIWSTGTAVAAANIRVLA